MQKCCRGLDRPVVIGVVYLLIAAAAVYLASPAADFVTGHCLSVDGGYVAW